MVVEKRFPRGKLPVSGANPALKKRYARIATKVMARLHTVFTRGVNDVPEEVRKGQDCLRQAINRMYKHNNAYNGWPRVNGPQKTSK